MKNVLPIFLFFTVIHTNAQNTSWWKNTTVYQIYPRSFYDTNADGIGDIQGIIEKLDYIKQLGFETIWVSPFFASPQQDFGYDISNYYAIAPEYGTMQEVEKLIKTTHEKGMKIVFDLVMNHTSAQHDWFLQSAIDSTNDKADWYVWRNGKGKKNKKPNNWKAMIGGSGWHWHEDRQQYYWASFLPFQPDLNYHNEAVRKAMLQVARYWLQKGVDGFRLDIFNALYEDSSFQNNPFSFKIVPNEENPNGFFQKAKYTVNQAASFQFATQLRALIDSFQNPSRFLVGEVFGDAATIKKFCQYQNQPGLHTVFLFKTLSTKFKANPYKKMVQQFEKEFASPLMPTYVFSNHDRKRSFSRLIENEEKAKLLALFQFTVRGIPFTYYGEEIGMTQMNIPLKQGKDPLAKQYQWIPQFIVNMSGEALNRDGCRTPMQWSQEKNSGFSNSDTTWLPLAKNDGVHNVQLQQTDTNGLWHCYQKIISLRNKMPVLQSGNIEIDKTLSNKRILAYYRKLEGHQTVLVLLNFSGKNIVLENIPKHFATILGSQSRNPKISLHAYEGKVIELRD